MKISKLAILSFAFFIGMQSFATNVEKENRTRKTDSFHAIKVSSGIDLYLKQGNSEAIIVEADDDIIDNLITEVKDGVLKIYMDKNLSWKWNRERKVYVTFTNLDLLSASAGSDVESESLIHLKVLKLDVSSGSDLELDINADEIYLHTSSGSDAVLRGEATFLKASSSSGSDINASGLKAKKCEISASSGFDAAVYASDEIKANASSGADIRYSGNPTKKDIDESSGGDVYKR